MGCQTSRLSGSFNVVHSTHDEGRYFHQQTIPPWHNHHPAQQPQQYTRPDSPSVYSSHTRTTPSHSRNNSQEQNKGSNGDIKRPLLAGSQAVDYGSEKSKLNSGFSIAFLTPGTNQDNRSTFLKSIRSRSASQKTPHFVFQKEKPLPSITPEALSDRPPMVVGSCGHQRQQGTPCFACLREKPKPRRHRSRRNAQVMIPRASFVSKKWRKSRSSTEAPLREEDLPAWVTTRHSVFVQEQPTLPPAKNPLPSQPSTERDNAKRPKASLGGSTNTSTSTDAYPASIMRGYILPSEVYYATLPLPALPTESAPVFDTKKRKNHVWI
ncbi:hypothetical protein FRB91_011309 [Serendipita sp. 411]|nr:hypothetical protein FRC15_000925 [Serendipita sp. 397]KAG8857498.1 hypothetical protein FRB91_011309 [Serendipita sp. 411]